MTQQVGSDGRAKLLIEGTLLHEGHHAAAACHCRAGLRQHYHLDEAMVRHTFERLRKRLLGLTLLFLAQSQRTDRVPGVRAALTRVEVTGRLRGELSLEFGERAGF